MKSESTGFVGPALRKYVVRARRFSKQEGKTGHVRDVSKHLAHDEYVAVSGKDSICDGNGWIFLKHTASLSHSERK